MDGPPVWIVTVIPCCFAHRTIGAASLPVLTEPSPISPTSFTPAARHLREVLLDHAELEDRRAGVHLHAGGAEVRVRLGGDDGERLQARRCPWAARAGAPRRRRSSWSRRR